MLDIYQRLVAKLHNMIWEYRLGIITRGVIPTTVSADSYRYSTISYSEIIKIVGHIDLKPADEFVDIGSGKGRVVCFASRYDIQKVIGIEADKNLCSIAEANVKKMRGPRCPIDFVNIRAEEYDYLTGTVFYLFNPFGSATLDRVLKNMRSALQIRPRRVKVVYVNSCPQVESVMKNCGFLVRYDYWSAGRLPNWSQDVSFWKTPD